MLEVLREGPIVYARDSEAVLEEFISRGQVAITAVNGE